MIQKLARKILKLRMAYFILPEKTSDCFLNKLDHESECSYTNV